MAKAPPKTNAARALEAAGVAYELKTYDVDEDDLSAETVAAKVGLPAEQVWKTLCVKGAAGHYFAVLPGDQELDLKALARLAGERKVEPVAVKELQGLTGYIRGGVTVLAAKKAFPVFVDELCELYDVISVSAGQRGLQLFVDPMEYVRATSATVGAIARAKAGGA